MLVNNKKKLPLVEALKEYSDKKPAYFCIPGHRFGRGISGELVTKDDKGILKYDLTEVTGLDDLHQPSGVISEAQELMAQLFHAQKSFFLVNGTTCGNEAMILNTAKEGDKIIVPRNAHKSILSGLVLSGATPVYVDPQWIEEWNIWGGVLPAEIERLIKEQPDIKGVVMASPSYYGVVSQLKKISKICQENNCLLLVDEAHGAHLYFSDELPSGAIECGADVCVQSLHKTVGSLTQSSVLHVASDDIDIPQLQSNLQILQSSSPSYLLMASLDAARYELGQNGRTMGDKALELARFAREQIANIEKIDCLGKEQFSEEKTKNYAIADFDPTKLVITASKLGLSGFELKEILVEKYNIEVELADAHNILAIVTFANIKEEMEQLIAALQAISTACTKTSAKKACIAMPPLPEMRLTPRKAHFSEKTTISWNDCVGAVAGEAIIPYPPGIPVVYPGEVISQEVWDFVERYREMNCHFHGVMDESLQTIAIIKENVN